MNRTNKESGFTLTEVCVATLIMGPLMVAFISASNVVGNTMAENERAADVTTVARTIGDKIGKLVMRSAPDTLRAKPAPLVRVLQTDVVTVPPDSQFVADLASDPTAVDGSTTGVTVDSVTTSVTSTTDASGLVTDTSGTLVGIRQTGSAITTVTSLKDAGDGSHFVTPYNSYSEYRDKYAAWEYAERTGQNKDNWQPVTQFVPTESLQFAAVEGKSSTGVQARTLERSLDFVRDPAEKLNGIDDDRDGMIDEGKLIMTYGKTKTILADRVEVCTFTLEGRVVRFAIRCCRRDHHGRVHRTTIQKRILIRNNN